MGSLLRHLAALDAYFIDRKYVILRSFEAGMRGLSSSQGSALGPKKGFAECKREDADRTWF